MNKRGFTLLEMLVALVIMGIIGMAFNQMVMHFVKFQRRQIAQGKHVTAWCETNVKCPGILVACLREDNQSNGSNKETLQACTTSNPCTWAVNTWRRGAEICSKGVLVR